VLTGTVWKRALPLGMFWIGQSGLHPLYLESEIGGWPSQERGRQRKQIHLTSKRSCPWCNLPSWCSRGAQHGERKCRVHSFTSKFALLCLWELIKKVSVARKNLKIGESPIKWQLGAVSESVEWEESWFLIQLWFLLRYLSRCCEVLPAFRAPTIFQNDWVCTRISNFLQSPIFSIARLAP